MRSYRALILALTATALLSAASSITLTSSANPSTFGQPVTLTATLSPAVPGKVAFYDGETILGVVPLNNGTAELTTRMLPSGTRSVQAASGGVRSNLLVQTVQTTAGNGFAPIIGSELNGVASAVGDFDGDGNLDQAVAVFGIGVVPGAVNVRLGHGDGTFSPPVAYPAGNPVFVAVADFNGDGFADLAVAGSDGVYELPGNGDGTFQPAIKVVATVSAQSIAIADFNGDGVADMAVAQYASSLAGSISILLGNGDGTFQAPVNYAGTCRTQVTPSGTNRYCQRPFRIAVADFNADGKADLAVSNGDSLGVYPGNGDGTFQTPEYYAIGDSTAYLAAGDLNGDGLTDLAFVNFNSLDVYVMLANGDGSFQPPLSYPLDLPSGNPRFLVIGDFDADGILDIAAGADLNVPPFQNYASLLKGRGDGSFQPAANFPTGYAADGIAADFNGDGRIDIGSANGVMLGSAGLASSVELTSSLNPAIYGQTITVTAALSPPDATGQIVFSEGSTVLGTVGVTGGAASLDIGSFAAGTHPISAAYSGDLKYAPAGAMVEQIVNPVPETITLSSSLNPSTYGQPVTLTAALSPPSGPGTVTFLDGAAKLGVRNVIAGVATLATSLLTTGAHSLTAVYSGDANHASALSAAMVQSVTQGAVSTPVITLTSSANPAAFGKSVTLDATLSVPAVTGAVTFYDGAFPLGSRPVIAGRASLTTSSLGSGARALHAYYSGDRNYTPATSPSLVENMNSTAAGAFQLLAADQSGGAPPYLAEGDFNEDGTPDLVVANAAGGTIAVRTGIGDGTFTAGSSYSVGGTPQFVMVCDLNGDGHLDLAVANGDDISVLLGKGDGGFAAPVHYSTAGSPVAIAAGDFDGDGMVDLAVIGTGLAVLPGKGDGTFRPAIVNAAVNGAGVVSADFNSDGIPDLAIVNPGVVSNMAGLPAGPAAGPVFVLLGAGDGTFLPALDTKLTGNSLALGDFNGDGKPDLAVAAVNTSPPLVVFGWITVGLANGDGTFQPGNVLGLPGGVSSVAAADFDGDGKLDLAAFENSELLLLPGAGDGTFPLFLRFAVPVTNPFLAVTSIAVADFDGDGRIDLAAGAGGAVNLLLGAPAFRVSVTNIRNAASLQPGILVGGSIGILEGVFPVQPAQAASGQALPTSLAGLSLRFGSGVPAPLFSVAPDRVTFQVPWNSAVSRNAGFIIAIDGQNTQPISTPQLANSSGVGIFTVNGLGTGQGMILDASNHLVDAANPAVAGTTVVQIYCTGLTNFTATPPDGSSAPANPLVQTQYNPLVSIGGAAATVQFSGLTPGAVGLEQVNVLVPGASARGDAVPVSILGSNTVTMAVK